MCTCLANPSTTINKQKEERKEERTCADASLVPELSDAGGQGF